MTIQNLESFIGGLWDWAILAGCFGESKIMPTDVDGMVEHNGHFLLIEAKRPGVAIKTGQRLFFERFVQLGRCSVIVAWGDQNEPESLLVMTPRMTRTFDPAGLATFRSVVAQWYAHAHQQPRIGPRVVKGTDDDAHRRDYSHT